MTTLIACLLSLGAQLDVRSAEIHGKFFVLAPEGEAAGKVMFPLPRLHRGQVPVSFELRVKPESAVKSKTVHTTPTGDYVLELACEPMAANKRFEVDWRSQLLVDMNERADIPKTPIPTEFPAEVNPWLRPSAYVQSDHSEIKRLAATVKADTYAETVSKTLFLRHQIVDAQKGIATELSSVTALTKKGSCTSEANLLAALLRANQIPARLVSGYPTYANRPYDTHYIVEVYAGDAGWIPADLGMSAYMVPIVSVVSVENENLGGRRIAAAEGVPFLSVTETTGRLVARGLLNSKYSEHEAKLDLKKKIDSSTWAPSRTRFTDWLGKIGKAYEDLPSAQRQ